LGFRWTHRQTTQNTQEHPELLSFTSETCGWVVGWSGWSGFDSLYIHNIYI